VKRLALLAALLFAAAPAGAVSIGIFGAWQTHDMNLFPDRSSVPNVDLHEGPATGIGLGWRAWSVPWALQLEQVVVRDELIRDDGYGETWDLGGSAVYLTGEYPLPTSGCSPRWHLGAGVGWIFTSGSATISEGTDQATSVRAEGNGPLAQIYVDAEFPLGQWRLEPRLGWRWAEAGGAYKATSTDDRDVTYTGLVLQLGLWVDLAE